MSAGRACIKILLAIIERFFIFEIIDFGIKDFLYFVAVILVLRLKATSRVCLSTAEIQLDRNFLEGELFSEDAQQVAFPTVVQQVGVITF